MSFCYYMLYKPYGVISQFTREAPHHRTLGELYDFPSDVYPVGRLDQDSEGLLLLTNDKRLNQELLHPAKQHHRRYLVQVEGVPSEQALKKLSDGVHIRINKRSHLTLPAKASLLAEAPLLPDRDPPIRVRKNIPDSWLSIELVEGKNRQVRRMCAAVGYPVLRLVRYSIEALELGALLPGEVRELDRLEIRNKLYVKLP